MKNKKSKLNIVLCRFDTSNNNGRIYNVDFKTLFKDVKQKYKNGCTFEIEHKTRNDIIY